MSDSKILNTLLAVVPVITAGLYLIGFSHHQGFLDGYMLEGSLFPLASDLTLLHGFYAFAPAALSFNAIYSVIPLLLVVSMAILALLLASNSRLKAIQNWIKPRPKPIDNDLEAIKKKLDVVVEKSTSLSLYFLGILSVFLMAIFVAVFAYKSGKEVAIKEQGQFNAHEGKWIELYSSHSTLPVKALQITCGNTHCAFWLGDEALILAHDKIEKVVAHRAKRKS